MSEENKQDWQTEVRVIALDVEKAAVLLYQQGDGSYHLPSFTMAGGRWETTTAKLQEQVGSVFNIEGQFLFRASYEGDKETGRGEAVMILETASPEDESGTWFSLDNLEVLAASGYLPLVESVLTELETGVFPAYRAPWARPGWYQEAAGWLEKRVSELGWTPVGSIKPVRSWALSYLMALQAQNGSSDKKASFFFKSSVDLPLFVNEAVVTKALAAMFPGHIPDPVALDGQKNWMVMADFGPDVGHDAPLEERLEVLRQFAGIQKESADQIEQLIAIGCIDRRLNWLVSEIEPFLSNPKIAASVTAEEAAQLQALVRPLETLVRKLYAYNVPDTLIHGDLHGSNVARNERDPDKLIFFDWTDCAVSHPFFDMLLIYTAKDPAEQETMRDVYLTQWLAYEPMDRLLGLWQMAKVLAAVYHGISYIYISEGLEQWGKGDMYWAIPYWLRKILEYGEVLHE